MSVYIELHTSSAFSFLDGASLPATLIERAAELGYPALALLDRDGLYGAPQFYRAAKAAGLKAIVGAELTMGRARHGPAPQAADVDACPCSSSSRRGLSQSLPHHHAREAASAERRGARSRSTISPARRAGLDRARRPRGARRPSGTASAG